MKRKGLSHARLMRDSEDCLENALRCTDADNEKHLVATRILETTGGYHRWESEHSRLMRNIAESPGLGNQVSTLKRTTLSLIHGRALFGHLKANKIRGYTRSNLIRHFYPNRGYTAAVVAEHGHYLRRSCSFLCTNYLGEGLLEHDEFFSPLYHYEQLYAEYFDLYCRLHLPGEGVESASERSLLPLLKHQLGEWRWKILNPREGAAGIRRELEIRASTGDTQKLRIF